MSGEGKGRRGKEWEDDEMERGKKNIKDRKGGGKQEEGIIILLKFNEERVVL